MRKILTREEHRQLQQHFRQVVKNDPLLSAFPRSSREIFVHRMIEVELARLNGEELPTFPPEGFEIELHPPKERLKRVEPNYQSDVQDRTRMEVEEIPPPPAL